MKVFTIALILPLFFSSNSFAEEKNYQSGKILKITSNWIDRGTFYSGNPVGSSYMITGQKMGALDYAMSIDGGENIYILSYVAKMRWSYVPRWIEGETVNFRVNSKGNKAWVVRPDGKELKMSVFRKFSKADYEKIRAEKQQGQIPTNP